MTCGRLHGPSQHAKEELFSTNEQQQQKMWSYAYIIQPYIAYAYLRNACAAERAKGTSALTQRLERGVLTRKDVRKRS